MPAEWSECRGDGPIIAVAVHNGHRVRPEVARLMALSDSERLREEDPFTGLWAAVAPTRLIGLRSRFEVDLNRPPERAVYRVPEDAWGLEVWAEAPDEGLVERSLEIHRRFYARLHRVIREVIDRHGWFVMLDIHSYNHRRGGPDAPVDDPEANPDVNIGTGTLDRERWSTVVDCISETLAAEPVAGRALDVRENVKFRGGYASKWANETFPGDGCAVAIEFKKIFMDEWTGEPDFPVMAALHERLRHVVSKLQSTVHAVPEAG